MRHSSLLVSMSLAAMLVLAMPVGYTNFANAQSGPSVSDPHLKVERVASGLTLPTTMAFLDQNRILVLEKDNGTVRMIENGKLQPQPLLDVAVANDNERGMLGIAVSKENDTTTYVFVYFTQSGGGVDGDDKHGVQPAGNRLYRYELQGDHLVHPKLLLNLPSKPGDSTGIIGRYVGGPLAIGPDGFVYVVIGDVDHHRTEVQNFQNSTAADGTSGVLRVGKNGEVPPSIIGSGTFGKYYFAYGIRNSFGLAFDPSNGKLWDTENGPAHGDEINLVGPGFNSGWAKVSGMATPQNLTGLVLFNSKTHYSNPEFSWTEPVAPTGLAFLNSTKLGAQYQNNMFVGDFNNGALYRFELNSTRTGFTLSGNLTDKVADTPSENAGITFGTGFGGISDVKAGPDGNLYVVSLIEGAIYKISSEGNVSTPVTNTADLTVKSVDLSGHPITGMFTTIKASNGTILQEGYTPLTFTGDKGSTYTVTVADFQSRTFDHWDNKDTSKTRTITLDQDTTITAYYNTNSATAGTLTNSQISVINRLIDMLNKHNNCIGEKDANKIDKSIEKIVKDIFGNSENTDAQLSNLLRQTTNNCLDVNIVHGHGNGGDNAGD